MPAPLIALLEDKIASSIDYFAQQIQDAKVGDLEEKDEFQQNVLRLLNL